MLVLIHRKVRHFFPGTLLVLKNVGRAAPASCYRDEVSDGGFAVAVSILRHS